MSQRIEVRMRDKFEDTHSRNMEKLISQELELSAKVRSFEAYNINHEFEAEDLERIGSDIFSDKIVQEYNVKDGFYKENWRIEVGYLPGVTDNKGKTATDALKDAFGNPIEVYYSRNYAIIGKFSKNVIEKISNLFFNKLIERAMIHEPFSKIDPYIPKVKIKHNPQVEEIDISNLDAKGLRQLSKDRLLALNLKEMDKIKRYFGGKRVIDARKKVGLSEKITDVELESLAQTWSEHCKHKIFNAHITYTEDGEDHAIDSIFSTFIKAATQRLMKPYVVSVFKDNGGIIKFDSNLDVAIKVETHNSPSALDPYGGALTGILGVNRDILGCGLGAKPIANMNMLCFGELDAKELPEPVLHPKKIYGGVIQGIQDGGNCSGIPTVNGSVTFEKGYNTRPLVYAGTVGIMPGEIDGRNTAEKRIEPGYLAIMAGGRIGKDGIHGATFSSQQLEDGVPQSVVQIGDPFTQKKLLDFTIEARDKRLFESITDNGAGGLSSSIGEMAQISDGCEIYLEKAPLKYPGLNPWEILVSESQERMSLAIIPEKLEELEELAKKHDVEISVVGKFTNTGKFHCLYDGKTVCYLDMKFFHDGVPQMKLKATWAKKTFDEPIVHETDLGKILHMLLKSPNIASKEQIVRRYDHEVQGGSVIKPIVRGPNDSGVIRPDLNSNAGLVIGHGMCPRYIQDSYDMSAMALDEAVRNVLAVGGKFGYLACLDNFSWPNPLPGPTNPDSEYKLAQLVRSCLALYDYTTSYGIPIISGKDSMKNDYYYKGRKYSIPPTLLITVIGKIDDVNKALGSEFKKSGDNIYVLGITRDELGGSEYYKLFNGVGSNNPKVVDEETIPLYKAFSNATQEGILLSAHDVSDGGLGVALAECCIGSGLGADVDISLIPKKTEKEDSLMFSESAGRFVVSVSQENESRFEAIFKGIPYAKVGRVRGDKRVIIRRDGDIMVNEDVLLLEESWKETIKA